MQVFNEYTMQAMLETLDLMLVTFNTASRGAIILNPERVSHQSKRQRGRPKQSLKWFKMP
nr:major capsid protein [Pseudomonas sp. MWU349]